MQQSATNQVILRDDMQRGKVSGFPDKDFRYGQDSGVRSSMHIEEQFDWQCHKASQPNNTYKDFKKFNKICVKEKTKSNKDVKNLQKSVDYTSNRKTANGQVGYRIPEEEFMYGLRYKYSF